MSLLVPASESVLRTVNGVEAHHHVENTTVEFHVTLSMDLRLAMGQHLAANAISSATVGSTGVLATRTDLAKLQSSGVGHRSSARCTTVDTSQHHPMALRYVQRQLLVDSAISLATKDIGLVAQPHETALGMVCGTVQMQNAPLSSVGRLMYSGTVQS
jgi:hypothetical protein